MTGLVLSGFGLSAFYFAAISRLLYSGDTSSLLLFRALGTSFPMILGYFLVRPIPLPYPDVSTEEELIAGPLPQRVSLSFLNQDGYAHSAWVDGILSSNALVL